MIKAILFDFDGTLADTAPGILLTMQETFKEMGCPVPSDADIIHSIGLPLVGSIKMLGGFTDEETNKGVEIYRKLFPSCELNYIKMFPEVAETLKELSERGIRMAICTSRGKDSLQRILSRYGLWDLFETAVTASDNLPPKPAPDMVLALLDRMGLSPDEAIVVGDTTFDIGMGNSARCRTVAVTYGNHSRAQLLESHPTYIIDHFSELISLS